MGTNFLIGLGIIVGFLLVFVIIFRKQIQESIERGSGFEVSLSPKKGAKFLLGGSKQQDKLRQANAQPNLTPEIRNRDYRLGYLEPAPDLNRFFTVALPKKEFKYYDYNLAPSGIFIVRDVPFFLQPVGASDNRFLGHHAIDIAPSNENQEMMKLCELIFRELLAFSFCYLLGEVGAITMAFNLKESVLDVSNLILGIELVKSLTKF